MRRQSTFENQLDNVLGRAKLDRKSSIVLGAPECKLSNIFNRLETNLTKNTTDTMFDQFKKELYIKVKAEQERQSEIQKSRKDP